MTPVEQILLSLFSGVIGIVVGAILGGYFTAKFTYRFQQKILTQQLEASEKSHHELMTWLEKSFLVGILTRWNTTFHKEIYPMITPTLDKLDRALDKAVEDRPKT